MADLNDIYLKACDYFEEIANKIPSNPLTDIYEDLDTKITYVDIALPGFKKENITLVNENNQIIVTAKAEPLKGNINIGYQNIFRKDAKRILTLNRRYLGGSVSAQFKDGILRIVLKPAEDYSNKIEIQDTVTP
jgi:hypothetical protein